MKAVFLLAPDRIEAVDSLEEYCGLYPFWSVHRMISQGASPWTVFLESGDELVCQGLQAASNPAPVLVERLGLAKRLELNVVRQATVSLAEVRRRCADALDAYVRSLDDEGASAGPLLRELRNARDWHGVHAAVKHATSRY